MNRAAMRLSLAVFVLWGICPFRAGAAEERSAVPLVNKLGFKLAFLRTDVRGHSGPVAADVADGATVMLDDATLSELRDGAALIVRNAEDENASAPPLQFLPDSFPEKADSLALALRNGVPVLQFFDDGHHFDEVPAGLPLESLINGMERGMEPGDYAYYMTPLEADGWESYPFAVRTGDVSWRLLPPGPVFTVMEDGERWLSSISFGRDNRRIDLTFHNDGAFDGMTHSGMWLAAKTVEEGKGLAERYVLREDGSFVHASSDFGALEQERGLFKAGDWTVTDNELRLKVDERWIVPVGGAENIAPSDTVTVVGGVVKRTYNPPETEVYPIARAKKDPETGRSALTIDGTTFFRFDDRADFLERYYELYRAQKVDFASLKDVLFTYASGAGAWRTNLAIQPDGTFSGQYSDANMGEQGPDFPNGSVYICNFSGVFSSLEKADEAGYAYTLKCEKLSQEGTPEEEKIIDGVRYVNAGPFGLESAAGAAGITLFLPGTPYDKLPESYARDRGMEFEDGEIPVLEDYMLYFPKDYGDFYGASGGASGDDSDYRMYGIDWK